MPLAGTDTAFLSSIFFFLSASSFFLRSISSFFAYYSAFFLSNSSFFFCSTSFLLSSALLSLDYVDSLLSLLGLEVVGLAVIGGLFIPVAAGVFEAFGVSSPSYPALPLSAPVAVGSRVVLGMPVAVLLVDFNFVKTS